AGEGSRPVKRGEEYLTIYANGLGPVLGKDGEAPPPDGSAAPLSQLLVATEAITATIGGVDAPVTFAGLVPSLVSLYQINVAVPPDAPAGDGIPLVITATDPDTGVVQSNSVTISVQ